MTEGLTLQKVSAILQKFESMSWHDDPIQTDLKDYILNRNVNEADFITPTLEVLWIKVDTKQF